jgi:hypothetical protein
MTPQDAVEAWSARSITAMAAAVPVTSVHGRDAEAGAFVEVLDEVAAGRGSYSWSRVTDRGRFDTPTGTRSLT